MTPRQLLSPLVFLLVAACFLLPFLRVSVDPRRADATGVELMSGDAVITGRYVHDSYRGEVESLVDDGRPFAAFAFGCTVAGFALAWLRGSKASWAGVILAILGLLGMLALWQATTPAFEPPESDHRYGFWLGTAAFLVAAAWSVVRVRHEPRGRAEESVARPPWAA
jgi:hypothetical protein